MKPLFPLQRASLKAAATTKAIEGGGPGGAILALAVGSGKTLVGLLVGAVLKAKKPLYLAPAALLPQLERMRAEAVSEGFNVPPNLLIMSYSALSQAKNSDFLHTYQPDMIYADECHTLKERTSARTKRVARYLEDPDPDSPGANCAFIGASGTLLNDDPTTLAHLFAWALPASTSLLPKDHYTLKAWGRVLGSTGEPPEPSDWVTVRDLIRASTLPDGHTLQERARNGFAQKIAATPGVVVSPENAVKASLRIYTLSDKEVFYPQEIYKKVAATGVRPDGYVFEDDMELWACLNHLALGFYYRWKEQPPAEWLLARSDWLRHLRVELQKNSRPTYDSPHLVEKNIEARGSAHPLYGVYSTWRYVEAKFPAPVTEAVRVSPFPIPVLLENQLRGKKIPTLFWYQSKEVADALEAKSRTGDSHAATFPVYRSGDDIDTAQPHTCALSIQSHGKGLNLQGWSRMVFLEIPGSGLTWEQNIGRVHRTGQLADTVEVLVYLHTPLRKKSFKNAQADAKCIQETLSTPQKLCYADIVAGFPVDYL